MPTARRLLALVVAVVGLAGCIKFDTNLTVRPDDTVDGSVVVAFSRRLLDLPGFGDLFEQLDEAAPETQPSRGRVTTRPYEDDRFRGVELVLEDVPIDEVGTAVGSEEAGPGSPEFSITREGDRFRFSGTIDLSTGEAGDLPIPGVQDLTGAEVRVQVAFPGEVIEANGRVDGNRVTWQPALGEVTRMEAVGSARPAGGGGRRWLPLVLGGLGILAAVAVAIAVVRRRPTAGPPAPAPGPAFPPPPLPGPPSSSPPSPPTPPSPPPPPGSPLPPPA